MVRKQRHYLPEKYEPSSSDIKHLSRMEFGRKLHSLLRQKGWSQVDLHKKTDIGKDSISTYVNGKVYPSQINLDKMAKALGVKPEDLLPNIVESAIDEDASSLELRVSTSAPGAGWLRINRLVSMKTAAAILALLEDEEAVEAGKANAAKAK